jgi:hypothetical protein
VWTVKSRLLVKRLSLEWDMRASRSTSFAATVA